MKIGCFGAPPSRTWIPQYDACYFVMNEDRCIVSWMLCSSTSGEVVEPLLRELKSRTNVNARRWYTDKCCGNGGDAKNLKKIFGQHLIVSLDLFHGIQRVGMCMSKKHPDRSKAMTALSACFRARGDNGKKRLVCVVTVHFPIACMACKFVMFKLLISSTVSVTRNGHMQEATPSEQEIGANLDAWEAKFRRRNSVSMRLRLSRNRTKAKSKPEDTSGIITPAVRAALAKLRIHVTKGCLSHMPAENAGTSKNEYFHRLINRLRGFSRISPELAYHIISHLVDAYNQGQAYR